MSLMKDGSKFEVWFVRRGEDAPEGEDNLQRAFEAMDSHQLEPMWVTEEEVLRIERKESKLFVVDPFEGEAFEHLVSLQCRVLGPLCISYCLQFGDMLPKRPYPVYSVSMRKMTVSCSNIDNERREDVKRKVVTMGGLFSKDLTKSVSHLVVGEVGSKKYQVAASFGLPIMMPDWVEDVWKNGQYQQIHASDASYDKFKCPVFKGLVITVSQLSAEERTAVQTLVTENGGTYLAPLKAHKTTHLVLVEPTGDKYRYAKTWKVFCVNVNWIYESIKTGYCKDENLYRVDSSTVPAQPKRSTPNKDATSLDLPAIDCSVITNASVITHLDETMKSEVSFQVPAARKASTKKSSLDSFDLSGLPKYGQFLDGCKIFLTGFGSSHLDKLRRIVNSGGAIRFSKYTDSISHVVCGDLTPEFRQTLKDSTVKPYVVSHEWLLECCRSETLADEKPFLCVDVTLLSPEKEEPGPKSSFNQSQKSQQQMDDPTPDNITSIFNQYVAVQDKSSLEPGRASNTQSRDGDKTSKVWNATDRKSNVQFIDIGNEDHPHQEETDDPDETQSSQQLFIGLKFVILGFGEKDTDILTRMIESHSGVVFGSDSAVADIAVVPIIMQEYETGVPNIVTNCWLQKCIEDSRIYDFDENELFRPIPLADETTTPFRSFVISVSQYTGTERDCLMHLAEVLGATCQEYFVRKANKSRGIQANTHLIAAAPEGSKYEAAKKWNIPVLTKKWVLDTAKSGSPPPTEAYLVDNVDRLPEDAEDDIVACDPMADIHHKENLDHLLLPGTSTSSSKNFTPRRNSKALAEAGEAFLTPVSTSFRKSDGSRRSDPEKLEPEFKTPRARGSTSSDDRAVEENRPYPVVSTPQLKSEIESNFATPHRNVITLRNESKLRKTISPIVSKDEVSLSDTLNLDQSLNLNFHVSGLLRDLDTSATQVRPTTAKKHSMSIGEMFGRNLASALRGIDDKMQLDSSIDTEKSFNDSYRQPRKKSGGGVLKGVVLYVAKKLQHLQNELKEAVCDLGGEFQWSFDSTCTHFVFTGKANDITKEFREARHQGKKIVSPEWIYACRERNARVDEDSYPHTLKTNMTLADEISIVKTSSQAVRESVASSSKADEPVKDASPKSEAAPAKPDLQDAGLGEDGNVADFNQQLNDLLVAAKSAKRRQSKRVLDSVSSSPNNNNNNDMSPIHHLQQKRLSSSFVKPARSDENGDEQDLESQQSQSCPVVWDDPTGRMEREKIAAAMTASAAAAAAQTSEAHRELSSMDYGDMRTLDFESSKTSTTDVVGDRHPTPKKFMFTIIPDNKRLEYIEIIHALGGEVSDEKSFDVTATHLIMQKPMKNEKFLSSVASGKWILHPEYLAASQVRNQFVREEDYEWGGPSTVEFVDSLPASSRKIAHCPHQWRDRLARDESMTGAFHDWFVVIFADDKSKQSTYTKILEAGGAVVVPSEIARTMLVKITHVIVDVKKRSLSQVDFTPYLSHNIKCLKPEYLAFYLIEDPPPDIDTFVIQEVKELQSDSSTKRRNLSVATRGSKKSRLT